MGSSYDRLRVKYFDVQWSVVVVGAVMVERPASVDEGFSQQAPLVYHYGYKSLNMNTTLFNTLVTRMAEVIHDRMATNKKGNVS